MHLSKYTLESNLKMTVPYFLKKSYTDELNFIKKRTFNKVQRETIFSLNLKIDYSFDQEGFCSFEILSHLFKSITCPINKRSFSMYLLHQPPHCTFL